MKDKLIKNYINNLKKEDISVFATNNSINLNDTELNTIYNTIKTNYESILYGNHDKVFNELKDKVSSDNYDKIINLFFEYKKKYTQFL